VFRGGISPLKQVKQAHILGFGENYSFGLSQKPNWIMMSALYTKAALLLDFSRQ
tara:strand:- start:334 stop:495 length:162 start_codon:yes stop_codon:yes gene_type:complete